MPQLRDAGSYDVVVSGTCAPAVTSSAVTLTVNTAPVITTQPTNQTTCEGTSVSFSVTATGTGLTYQWRKGAVNIGGATASTYTIAAPIVGDAGSYDVVVSGTCAPAVTSSPVTLTVNTAPAITTQPTNQTTCAGTSVRFSVTATGTGLSYQWRKGAVNIVGATASTYTIAAPIVGDAGSYDVVVSGTCAPAVTSSGVTLTIDIPSAPITGTITQPTCIVSTGSVILSGLPAGNWIINPGSVAGNTVSTTLSGLASGTYVFTVTNASGCTSPNSGTLVINAQPVPPAQAILNIIQPTCSLATGTVTVTSPTGPYEYNIDGGVFQASVIFSGVATGSHIILVRSITDNTCVSASSAAIINAQPASPSVTISNPAAVCSTSTVDLTDAAITAGSTSGLTYTYWSDPAGTIPYTTPATATSGTYYIKGTNVSGCSDIKPVVVTVTSSVNISSLTTNIFCSGTSTGSINITVTGGTTPYSFAWTGNGVNTGLEDQSGLSAGIYSVVVTDALSCVSLPLSVTITEPSPLAGNVTSQTNVSVSGGSDGSVTIAGAGGTSPYQYRLGAGSLQPGGVFRILLLAIILLLYRISIFVHSLSR
ncbi:MAG: SprB repeat-containing protein [Bacteroidales bacterium]|nr:SprB repeat-containing protein [Bacteroidales bacterium]